MSMFDDLLGGEIDAGKNNLQLALRLAAQGIPVFPCREKTETVNGNVRKEKSPATKNGFKDASTDPAQIRAWWARRPYALVGMPTGKASGFAVLDLDRHSAERDGIAALAGMGYKPQDLTDMRAPTAGNGMHLYFEHQDGITNSDRHLPKGIDVRAEGGFVIAPGTMFQDGRSYGQLDLTRTAPAFPSAFLPPAEADRAGEYGGDKPRSSLSVDQIRDYMADLPNDEDMGREEWVGVIASLNHEANAPNDEGQQRPKAERDAIRQIAVDWTAKNPAYSTPEHLAQAAETFKTFKNSSHKNLRTFSSVVMQVNNIRLDQAIESVEDDFDEELDTASDHAGMFDDLLGGEADAPSPKKARKKKLKWQSEDAPEWIQKMNRKHAVIIVGGKASVMRFDPKSPSDEDHELWDMKTFHDWYLAKPTVPITVGKGKDGKPKIEFLTLSKAFMSNEFRRGYEDGYIFDTTSENTAGFNLFRGWGVEPKKGSCDRILWHIKHVICADDETANEYFLDYLAHMFQKPWEIPRAAIVVKGEEGAGKDTIAKYMHKLVGRYIPKITGQDQFFGNFNGFLKNALFVNIQEAFVGSQQQNEKLKQFVTEDMLRVENKYQNSHDTPNYMRIYITSNNFKVVQASESSRRFLVLNARDTYASTGVPAQEKMRQEYFDAIYDEMNGNGPAALLNFLLNRKLVNFPRTPPVTDELSTQVASGWKGMRKFIYQAALYGTFDLQNGEDNTMFKRQWAKGDVVVDKGDFRQRFIEWSRGRSARDLDEVELTPTAVTKLLDTMCGVQASRRRIGGQGERKHCYVFPRLALVRERIGKAARGKLEWGDEREVEEMAHEDEEDDL